MICEQEMCCMQKLRGFLRMQKYNWGISMGLLQLIIASHWRTYVAWLSSEFQSIVFFRFAEVFTKLNKNQKWTCFESENNWNCKRAFVFAVSHYIHPWIQTNHFRILLLWSLTLKTNEHE